MTSSWGQSLAIHLSVAFFFTLGVWLSNLSFKPRRETFEIPIELTLPDTPAPLKELEQQKPVVIKSVNTPTPETSEAAKAEPKIVRQVYGASRKSLTASEGESGIDFKKGNTLAKEADSTVLTDQDVDVLPEPTEEYLVSQMPQVLAEVRPEYPEAAKAERKEGSVALNVLIDDQGKVRQVEVIEGDALFATPAIEAMKKFQFKPAIMEGKNVAVRIRYTLRFVLEN